MCAYTTYSKVPTPEFGQISNICLLKVTRQAAILSPHAMEFLLFSHFHFIIIKINYGINYILNSNLTYFK